MGKILLRGVRKICEIKPSLEGVGVFGHFEGFVASGILFLTPI